MSDQDNITVDFDSVDEFLDYLSLTRNKDWFDDNDNRSTWIFRGHADAEWKLQPTAWRPPSEGGQLFHRYKQVASWDIRTIKDSVNVALGEVEAYASEPILQDINGPNSLIRNFIEDVVCQTIAEHEIVREFIQRADEVGHPIPTDNHEFMDWAQLATSTLPGTYVAAKKLAKDLLHWNPEGLHKYPFLNVSSMMALAQHHGIPTSLLDWTDNPLIAAYFAAEDLSTTESDQRIAVWALNSSSKDIPIRLFRPFRNQLTYLQAQRGLFTSFQNPLVNLLYIHEMMPQSAEHVPLSWYFHNNEWPDLVSLTKHNLSITSPNLSLDKLFRKITLPVSKCKELLLKLRRVFISKAHLKPTYDNVFEDLKTSIWKIQD